MKSKSDQHVMKVPSIAFIAKIDTQVTYGLVIYPQKTPRKDFKEPLFSVDKRTYMIKGNSFNKLSDFLDQTEVYLSVT